MSKTKQLDKKIKSVEKNINRDGSHTSSKSPQKSKSSATSNVPARIGSSSTMRNQYSSLAIPEEPHQPKKKWWSFIYTVYDKEKKTFLGRTFLSWLAIMGYGIIYLIFLATFTIITLFATLSIIKYNEEYLNTVDKAEIFSFGDNDIALTAVPSENDSHLIWYRNGDKEDYKKYVNELDTFLVKHGGNNTDRKKRDTGNLGPCGSAPYGYGDKPCVIIKINKQNGWFARPLNARSANAVAAPKLVRNWLKLKEQKLWLYCCGANPWDKEHIGVIKYYPNPPGFDPSFFPLNAISPLPLVAVQFTNFTLGISISVQCQLYYFFGSTTLEFVLYVAGSKII